MQRDEAVRSAHQAQAVAALSVGAAGQRRRLLPGRGHLQPGTSSTSSPSSLLRAGRPERHRLRAAGAAARDRAEFERSPRLPDRRTRRAQTAAPGADPPPSTSRSPTSRQQARRRCGRSATTSAPTRKRAPILRRARDRGKAAATPSVPLLPLRRRGINVYQPVYRDGAPTATVAQRRAALLGFAVRRLPRPRPRRGGDLGGARRRRRAAADRRRAVIGAQGSARRRRHGADPRRRPHLAARRPRSQPARASACRC